MEYRGALLSWTAKEVCIERDGLPLFELVNVIVAEITWAAGELFKRLHSLLQGN